MIDSLKRYRVLFLDGSSTLLDEVHHLTFAQWQAGVRWEGAAVSINETAFVGELTALSPTLKTFEIDGHLTFAASDLKRLQLIAPSYERYFVDTIYEDTQFPLNVAAVKHDGTKPPMHLIDSEFLEDLARVLDFGRQKYGASNWRKGMEWSRLYSAAMRHMVAWNRGENLDHESGQSHLIHAACTLMFLHWHCSHKQELDDRWKGNL